MLTDDQIEEARRLMREAVASNAPNIGAVCFRWSIRLVRRRKRFAPKRLTTLWSARRLNLTGWNGSGQCRSCTAPAFPTDYAQ